jgi:hypothetical protein
MAQAKGLKTATVAMAGYDRKLSKRAQFLRNSDLLPTISKECTTQVERKGVLVFRADNDYIQKRAKKSRSTLSQELSNLVPTAPVAVLGIVTDYLSDEFAPGGFRWTFFQSASSTRTKTTGQNKHQWNTLGLTFFSVNNARKVFP